MLTKVSDALCCHNATISYVFCLFFLGKATNWVINNMTINLRITWCKKFMLNQRNRLFVYYIAWPIIFFSNWVSIISADSLAPSINKSSASMILAVHDDVLKWKHFPRYWPFVWGIHRSSVFSLTKASDAELWCSSLICAWTNVWVNNWVASDLGRHRAHYDVIVIIMAVYARRDKKHWSSGFRCVLYQRIDGRLDKWVVCLPQRKITHAY